MKKDRFLQYKKAICAYRGDAVNVCEPQNTGTQHNLLMADTYNGKMAFKFNEYNIVQKNAAVSHIYNTRGIHVPDVKIAQSDDLFFETYRILDGITLAQAIKDGIGAQQIQNIYANIMALFAKMDRVYPSTLPQNEMNYVHNIGASYVANTIGRPASWLIKPLLKSVNRGPERDISVYHTGITPKNTIVSNDGHFVGFVDLDEACICNKNYAFAMMAAKYQEIGFDYTDLIKLYESVGRGKINREMVRKLVNASTAIKRTMWKLQQLKQKSK